MDNILQNFADQSRDAIMATDGSGTVRIWNSKQAEFSGVSGKEAIGAKIWNVRAQTKLTYLSENDHRKPTREVLRQFFDAKDDSILEGASEWKVEVANGEARYLHEIFHSMSWDGQRALTSVIRDITKQKNVEIKLRESTERLLDAQRFAGLGYWVWDVKSGNVTWTEEVYKIFRLDPETFTPQIDSIMALSPWPEENQRDQEIMNRAIQNKERGEFEQRFLYPDGTSGYYYSTFRGRYDKEANLTTLEGTVMDITESKRQEKELLAYRTQLEDKIRERTHELSQSNRQLVNANRQLEQRNKEINEEKQAREKAINALKQAQAKLIQSEKMASLGVLTAGVAHEINNPLNFISGGVMGLETHLEQVGINVEEDEDLSMLMESIKEGVKRASEIVKGLNQFSRDKDSFDESCDLHEIVENCLLMVKAKFPDGLKVERQLMEESAVIRGNNGKLHQVFINILYNAIQAFTEETMVDQPKIKIQSLRVNTNKVEVSISDNGCGISEENLSKISDPFFTTKKPGEGTGLGLSISYLIVNEHGGALTFTSVKGRGTTATIVLPVSNK